MLTKGHCIRDEKTVRKIESAKEVLSKYYLLNTIFNNFCDVSFNDIDNPNTVFRKCIMNTVESRLYLQELEQKISALKSKEKILSSQNSIEQNRNFITKLKSNIPSDFLSVIAEVHTAFEFLTVLGKNNWSYEIGKKKEQKPDFRIVLGQREVDLELIAVMKGDTRTKIETVFDELCLTYLPRLSKLKMNFTILIGIDTRSLVGDKLGIRVKDSINRLVKGLDDLKIRKLINLEMNLNLNFCEIKRIKNSYKLTHKDLAIFLAKLYSKEESDVNNLSRLIKKINSAITDSPFEFISIIHGASKQCIVIHPIDLYEKADYNDPNSLVSISKDSYLNQITRAIQKKGKKHQWKEGNPAIILIKTFNENVQHYDDKDYDLLPELIKPVKEALKSFPDVSGVLVYGYVKFDELDRCLYDGMYIKNESVPEALSISLEDLQRYNLLRKVDPPLEITNLVIKKDEKIETQREKINKLIEIYPELVNKNDLLLMLKSIHLFLLNDDIDKDLLVKLNEIVIECCVHTDPSGTSPFDSNDCHGVMFTISGVRNFATACLFKFLKYDKKTNLPIISRMSVDENTLVREAVADNLIHLYDIDQIESLRLGEQLIQDNQRVRCIIIKFVNHLSLVNDKGFFKLAEKIVNKFRRESYTRSNIDPLLTNTLRVVVRKGLLENDQEYLSFLDAILDNKEIGSLVKTVIALEITDENYLIDSKLKNKIIEISTKIYSNSKDPEMYPFSQFLNGLHKNKNSFLPEISSLLEKISKIKLKNANYDNFYLLDYLESFWHEDPEFSALIILNFITTNTIVNLVFNLNKILKIIADLIADDRISSNAVQDLRKSIKQLISMDEPFFSKLYEEQLKKIGLIDS